MKNQHAKQLLTANHFCKKVAAPTANDALAAAWSKYLAAVQAVEEVKPLSDVTVCAMYEARRDLFSQIVARGYITAEDISGLDRTAKAAVGLHLFAFCTPNARYALAKDPHHFVKSCAEQNSCRVVRPENWYALTSGIREIVSDSVAAPLLELAKVGHATPYDLFLLSAILGKIAASTRNRLQANRARALQESIRSYLAAMSVISAPGRELGPDFYDSVGHTKASYDAVILCLEASQAAVVNDFVNHFATT